jgi:serine/threonine-protein kinase
MFQSGDVLGNYEIDARLRSGGMATLFVGRRHGVAGFSRPVAIKVIHPHLAEDQRVVKMFVDEARISSHISHVNVVRVEEFGEHDGVYYIVMELVDGCSIEQLLKTLSKRDQRLAPEVAVHLALEIAAGLHAAHETVGEDGTLLHIVHRDISPSNVLITRAGNVKVIDFGIAKARGRLTGTRSGAGLKGKLRYMAPEQAWSRDVDRRTDVYSLGVLLWEMLTCRRLFHAKDDLALLDVVRNPNIPPPSQFAADVPAALDDIVLRATARDPAIRPQTASELRQQLARVMPGALSIDAEAIGSLVVDIQNETGGAAVRQSQRSIDTSGVAAKIAGGSLQGGARASSRLEVASEPGEKTRTTILSLQSADIERVDYDDDSPTTASPAPTPTGAGEVGARAPIVRWIAIGGGVVVLAIAVAIVIAVTGDDDAIAPPGGATPIETRVVDPPPPPPVVMDAAPPAVVATPPDAAPETVAKPRPRPRPRPGGATVKNVDGVILADEPARPKPKKKRKTVDVDGTPLTE